MNTQDIVLNRLYVLTDNKNDKYTVLVQRRTNDNSQYIATITSVFPYNQYNRNRLGMQGTCTADILEPFLDPNDILKELLK